MTPSDLVRVATDGAVACATLPFRYRDRLHLCVVVKASYEIVVSAAARPLGPSPIDDHDSTYDGNPIRSLERASEKVPYRPRCDVTLRGHAYPPLAGAAHWHFVRLGIARGGLTLLDRVLAVRPLPGGREHASRIALTYENARGGPGTDNPVGNADAPLVDPANPQLATGVGPISPFWPSRKRLLGSLDRRNLDQAIPSLPEATPWEYFQAAPREQQIEPLLGGERLVLDGVHPTLHRIETMIPGERVVARLLLTGATGLPAEMPISVDLSCDGLSIDADQLSFTLTWRGCCEVADERNLGRIIVLAATLRAGAEPDWATMVAHSRLAPAASASAQPTHPPAGDATHAIPERPGEGFVAFNPLPFVGAAPAAAPSTTATPWSQTPLVAPQAVIAGEATLQVGGGHAAVGESTHSLNPREHAEGASRPVAPFPLGMPTRGTGRAVPPWVEAAAAAQAPAARPGEGTVTISHPQRALPAPTDPLNTTRTSGAEQPAAKGKATQDAPLANALRNIGVHNDEVAALLAAISVPKK